MFDKLYIELEKDTLRYIFGSISGKKVNIKKCGVIGMAPGSFLNGKVINGDEFTKVLAGLKKELGKLKGAVYLTVNDGSFITRPVKLPIADEKDIDKHLSLEADQYLPINRQNFQVSFRVIARNTGDAGIGSSIMISAGPKENIVSILKYFDSCRINVKLIDAYPNNICRLVTGFDEEDFAVLDMRKSGINITVFENRIFYMHSYIPVDMEAVFDSFIKEKEIEKPEFRKNYFHQNYDPKGINQDGTLMDSSLRKALSEVLGQASRYLDYFNSRHFGKSVDNVYVIGENGMLKGLKGVIGNIFNTRVTIGLEPFDMQHSIEKKSFPEGQMGYYSLLGMMLRSKKL